ncbi:hypothetical protein [Frondihabitans sp. PAMC 28766]|uniref:hypothetical protein n=1 Tax=Frondihabitans sp. PAMC 28766 TaxID=1795630 RepID=UPI0012FF996B|nr:hypothetical protein [Frondihabitans sp. PAMC 28766]
MSIITVELGARETPTARATGIGSLVGLMLGAAYCLVGLLSATAWTSTEISARFDTTRSSGALALWQGAILAPAIMGAIAVFVALSASIDLARWPRSVCRAVGIAGPAAVGLGDLCVRVALAPS